MCDVRHAAFVRGSYVHACVWERKFVLTVCVYLQNHYMGPACVCVIAMFAIALVRSGIDTLDCLDSVDKDMRTVFCGLVRVCYRIVSILMHASCTSIPAHAGVWCVYSPTAHTRADACACFDGL